MRILVTGGAGFIGSNFLHYLCKNRSEIKIVVADLLTYAGNLSNIKSLIDTKQIEFCKVDIAEVNQVESLFKNGTFDWVINFAAESHVDRSIHDQGAFVRSNILGTQVLIDICRKMGVGRYIQISTDEVYGSLGPTGKFSELTPIDPSSPYSASKAAADLLVLANARTHGFPGIVTRCSNNYGPYHFPEKLIPLFITNALEDQPLPLYGDGLNVRSWLHVEDHCAAVLLVAEAGKVGEVYNIGGDDRSEVSNKIVTTNILNLLGKPSTLVKMVADRPGHDRRYAVDYSKINRELGWFPKITFEVGLKDTIEWYKNNQVWWREIKSGEYLKFYEKHYGSR